MTLRIYPYKFQEITIKATPTSDTVKIYTDSTVDETNVLVWEELPYITTDNRYIQNMFTNTAVPVKIRRMGVTQDWIPITLLSGDTVDARTILGISAGISYYLMIPASKYSNRTPVEGVYS